MIRRRIAPGALCIALAGCSLTPDYRPPTPEVPARWSEAPESGVPAATANSRWWTTLNDPELDSLVERALRANPGLQLAEARIREARARREATAASQWPSVTARASVARERDSENAPNPVLVKPDGQIEAPGQAENLFQAGFDATWELDLFGGTRRSIEAAQADLEATAYDRDAILLTLLAEVSRNYIKLRGVQEQIRIARESLVAQQDMLTLVRARYVAGMATDLDVARAEVQIQQTASQLPALDTSSKTAVHRLSVLLGQPPGALAHELVAGRPIHAPSPPLGLPSDLLRQRPDIRSAERHLAAASAREGVATTNLYPKFSLLGTVGLASVAAGDFFNSASTLWSVGPSMTWPIFQGGRIVATIKVRDAQQQEALIEYRRAILSGVEDVENAITAYLHEQAQQATLAKAVASEQRAVEYARERYVGGLSDFRDVLDAQRSLFLSQSELARHDTAVSLDLVALYKALGGGWSAVG
jgi:NodT family efflux transporter outer membrane factor (OMF) lipoprotein